MVFSLDQLRTSSVNLPVVGAVSIAAVLVVGVAIFFLTRRKKTVQLRF